MKQPEALRLGELLEYRAGTVEDRKKAAAELRRLYEANQAMLEALKETASHIEWRKTISGTMGTLKDIYPKVRAAIAKGEQA